MPLSTKIAAALTPYQPVHGPIHEYYREWQDIAPFLTNASIDIVLLFPVPPPPTHPWYEITVLPRPHETFFHFNPGYKF